MSKENNQSPEKKMTKYEQKKIRKEQEAAAKKRSQIMTRVVAGAIAVGVVGTLAWQGVQNWASKHGPYITVGNHKIDEAEFDYYQTAAVNDFLNTYGMYASWFGLDTSQPLDQQQYDDNMTWKDYFDQQAAEQIKTVYALYDKAKTDNFEYDTTDDVDSFVKNLDEYAAEQGTSSEETLKNIYGDNATLDVIKSCVATGAYADAYKADMESKIEVTEDDITGYYNDHKADYDSVDYLTCEIAADMPETEAETEAEAEDETAESETLSEEEQAALESEEAAKEEAYQAEVDAAMSAAQAKAEEMQGKVTDEASFKTLTDEYQNGESDTAYVNITMDNVDPYDAGEWLFDEARKAGDMTIVEDGDGYRVVYFQKRYLDEVQTVNVRHALVQASAETTDEMTEDEKTAAQDQAAKDARAKAEELYEQWKSGDVSEESFAAFAKENSEDSGSKDEGGLYENVTPGQMVDEFDAWIFDAARKAGDTDLVDTSYGTHIMYFVGTGDIEWHANIKSTIAGERLTTQVDELKASYEIKDKYNHLKYLTIETETESETEAVSETETTSETATETAAQ